MENETNDEIFAIQYLIQNNWELVVTKNPDSVSQPQWILKRRKTDGNLEIPEGIPKVYFNKNCKNPKLD